MTYDQTLEFLYGRLPMFSRTGAAAYKKDLRNTIKLCSSLGDPQNKFKTIHIAGTNGKGSVSHMLAAILQQCGYKTGLYTSPHIFDFGERIRINGEMIDRDFVISFVEDSKQLMNDVEPSFFELTVAMAFKYFAEKKVDIAIIETGLGGRLDSTNVITPLLSVITNVGLDHTDLLGNDIESIASEKAGIIKQNIPVVLGELLPETRSIFISKANEMDSEIHFAEERLLVEYIEPAGEMLIVHIKDLETGIVEKLSLDLIGLYQVKNARTVVAAVNALRKLNFEIPPEKLHDAFHNVRKLTGLRGRWEVLSTSPTVIADAAHNKDGIMQVIDHLKQIHPETQYHIIIGFVKDKDVRSVLQLLPDEAKYYFTQAKSARALVANELKEIAAELGITGEAYSNVNEALLSAKSAAATDDLILICGSFYILGELVGT